MWQSVCYLWSYPFSLVLYCLCLFLNSVYWFMSIKHSLTSNPLSINCSSRIWVGPQTYLPLFLSSRLLSLCHPACVLPTRILFHCLFSLAHCVSVVLLTDAPCNRCISGLYLSSRIPLFSNPIIEPHVSAEVQNNMLFCLNLEVKIYRTLFMLFKHA